jgi:hypothetical protein
MADNEDIKAKMREALDRKKPHDPGVTHADHHKGQGAPAQGRGVLNPGSIGRHRQRTLTGLPRSGTRPPGRRPRRSPQRPRTD